MKESIEGYKTQAALIERKIKALRENKDLVKEGIEKKEPTFAYEDNPAYWDAQRELYDIQIETTILEEQKSLNMFNDTIENLQERLVNIEGEKND